MLTIKKQIITLLSTTLLVTSVYAQGNIKDPCDELAGDWVGIWSFGKMTGKITATIFDDLHMNLFMFDPYHQEGQGFASQINYCKEGKILVSSHELPAMLGTIENGQLNFSSGSNSFSLHKA